MTYDLAAAERFYIRNDFVIVLDVFVNNLYFFCITNFTEVLSSHVSVRNYQDPVLSSLATELPEVLIQAKSKGTGKCYKAAFNAWCRWAITHGCRTLPAQDTEFSLYLISIIQRVSSPSSVDEAFYAVRWAHELAGCEQNPCASFIVKSVREAAHRILGHSVNKKEPVTPEMLQKLVTFFGKSHLLDIRNLTMCLIGFSGFLRFEELSHLKRSDIVFHEDFLTLFLPSSKTDVYREGNMCYIAKTLSEICPYSFLRKYLYMGNICDNSVEYIFRSVLYSKNEQCYRLRGSKPISYTRARECVLKMFEMIGLDKTKFGLHSLRSGGATAAANAGVADRLFKRHGRWRSETAKDGYVKDSTERLLQVSKSLGI